MVCTHTLYNEVWAGSLDLSVTELPEAMKRKQHKDSKPREHKKSFGTDISQRPEIAALRIEEGHWEGDTVVGKRGGKEAVVLSLLEKKTENYIAIRIPGKDADSVLNAMQSLREEFGDKFSQVFSRTHTPVCAAVSPKGICAFCDATGRFLLLRVVTVFQLTGEVSCHIVHMHPISNVDRSGCMTNRRTVFDDRFPFRNVAERNLVTERNVLPQRQRLTGDGDLRSLCCFLCRHRY